MSTLRTIVALGAAGHLRPRARDAALLEGFRELFKQNGAILDLEGGDAEPSVWQRLALEDSPEAPLEVIAKEAPRRRGRPKGSGLGLEVQVGLRLPRDVADQVDAAAVEQGKDRTSMVREIVTKWAERRARPKREAKR